MKKIIMTSLFAFMSFASMAADHCTDPTNYKVDKRCYVTDEQKKVAPYNAVVALVNDDGWVYCIPAFANAPRTEHTVLWRKSGLYSRLFFFI